MPHYDKELLAVRERGRRAYEEAVRLRAEDEKTIHADVDFLLGDSLSPEAVKELAELIHYAKYNYGPMPPIELLKELVAHRHGTVT